MPTAKPHTILPNNNKAWCVAVPIRIQPTISGKVDNCRVLRRPTASIMGPDNIDPNGVAAECILAMDKIIIIETYVKLNYYLFNIYIFIQFCNQKLIGYYYTY